jgi:hypothetical protein
MCRRIDLFSVVRAKAGTTAECVACSFVHGLNFQTAKFQSSKRHRPYSLRRRVRRLPFSVPRQTPRGWSAARRIHSIRAWRSASVLGEGRAPRGAPWRRFLTPGPRFQVHVSSFLRSSARRLNTMNALRPRRGPRRPCPASSSRRGRSAPRSGPGTSRCRGNEPQQQAPHPAPPSGSSLEDAPRRAGRDRTIFK